MRRSREDLLEAAFRLLETEGPAALQARRLTAEIGVSTMAVYTHFGSMPGLLRAIVEEGLLRFAAHVVRRTPRTDDPMTDLISGGLAYGEFAFQNSQLYRLMFGLVTRDVAATWESPEGNEAFSVLLRSVERVIDAGDFRPQDPRTAATQILSVTHGYILLELGGLVTEETRDLLAPLTVNLMVGLGADRGKAERSLARAVANRP